MILPRLCLVGLLAVGTPAIARCPEPDDIVHGLTVAVGRSRTDHWRAADGTFHAKLFSDGRPILETVSADGLLPRSKLSLVDPGTIFGFTYPHGQVLPLDRGRTLSYEAVTWVGGSLLATETKDAITLTVEDPRSAVTIGGCRYDAVTITEQVVPGALGFVGPEPAPAPVTTRLAFIPSLHLTVGLDAAGQPAWGLALGTR